MLPRRKAARSDVPAFGDLRGRLLSTDPDALSLDPTSMPLWGGLMDMTTAGGSATMAVIADGTVTLYTTTGGGLLGSGRQPAVARAAARFLDRLAADLDHLEPADDLPLPLAGSVRLSALTWRTSRYATAMATQETLRYGGHALAGLYEAAQEVIAEMRLLEESPPAGEQAPTFTVPDIPIQTPNPN